MNHQPTRRTAMTLDRERILAARPVELPFQYSRRDTMMHALGIGFGMNPLDADQLRFAYDANLEAFPTMSAVLGWVDLVRDARFRDPAWGIDADRTVVGEIEIRALAPLPSEGAGIARLYFAEVIDKGPGKGALLRMRKEIRLTGGDIAATLDTWLFVRGAGGFGGPREGGPQNRSLPERAADIVCDLPTPPNLALLYRLSLGDQNAVHADPHFARAAGFERPILHGIANFSISMHAVLRSALGYGTARFRGGQARMTSPVFPGDTLRTEMWCERDEVLFRTRALERDVPVMTGGRADLAPEILAER
jgi:acyl dehydratase